MAFSLHFEFRASATLFLFLRQESLFVLLLIWNPPGSKLPVLETSDLVDSNVMSLLSSFTNTFFLNCNE